MNLSIITATHYRPNQLRRALSSLVEQTCGDFEWVVINDGGDRATRQLIVEASSTPFKIVYWEMEHPRSGFGLCHARNSGIDRATGEIVAYLDDDNTVRPEFVRSTLEAFERAPGLKYAMCCQNRRRDVCRQGVIKQGTPFLSPRASCEIDNLLRLEELFDSNGFAHLRSGCPQWNPDYRIWADYVYLVSCAARWGADAFQLNPRVLVNYIQTSEGVIGSSSYREWAEELARFSDRDLPEAVSSAIAPSVRQHASTYWQKALQQEVVPAFQRGMV